MPLFLEVLFHLGEIIFHILIMFGMGVFYKESFDVNLARITDPIGPVGFPRLIIIFSFILLAISLFKTIRKYSKEKHIAKTPVEFNKVFLGILVLIALFIQFVGYLGFILSILLLLCATYYILGQRKIPKTLLMSFIGTSFFVILFGKILSVPLPRGVGILKILSYLIY